MFWQQYRHRPLTGRNQIVASICPQVYGLYVVKLAVALVLIGGVQVILSHLIVMAALCNRAGHYIFALFLLLGIGR